MSSGKFPTEYYKDMVENKYFGKVDRKDLGAVLRTFIPSAVFTVQSPSPRMRAAIPGSGRCSRTCSRITRSSCTKTSRP